MLLQTPPFAPTTLAALQQLGIADQAALRQTGADKAFLLLKAAGLTITESVLWQLVAVAENRAPHSVDTEEKQYWRRRIKQHPPVAVFDPPAQMQYWMHQALAEAEQALANNEVPVGAVVVHQGQMIGRGFNRCVADHNISRHAEICALSAASQALSNYRLDDCDLYVTLEPCSMCTGAIMQARIRRLIFAAPEPKSGAAGSVVNLFADKRLNPHTAVLGGVLADEARALLQRFFQHRRASAQSDLIPILKNKPF